MDWQKTIDGVQVIAVISIALAAGVYSANRIAAVSSNNQACVERLATITEALVVKPFPEINEPPGMTLSGNAPKTGKVKP
jgi:hypothetical protein